MEDEPEYDIAIAHVSGMEDISGARIQDAVTETLRRHEVRSARVCVAIVDDAHIAELNQAHLGRAGPTDVLAFDLRDGEHHTTGRRPTVDGEIVLSLETAVREASQRGHAEEAEATLYAVHGTLHLLGYDDQCAEDAAQMHTVEDEILHAVGFGTVYHRSDFRD